MMPRRSILVVLLVLLIQKQVLSRSLTRTSQRAAGPRRVLAAIQTASFSQGLVEDSLIVSFKPSAGAAASAGSRLIQRINDLSTDAAVATASHIHLGWSVIGPTSDATEYSGSSVLAATQSDVQAVAAQQSGSSSSSTGVQAIVIRGISQQSISLIEQSDDVEAVFPDLQVRVPDGMAPATMDLMSISAARRCANAPEINAGIVSKSAAVANMGWPAALAACGTNTYAVFVAQRCGNKFNLLEYKAIYAINAATRQIKKVRGRECSLFPQQTDKAKWFGACGVAPRAVSELPNMFCNSFRNCAGGVVSRAEPIAAAITAESAAAAAAAAAPEEAAAVAADATTDYSTDPAPPPAAAAAAGAVLPAQTTTSTQYRERVTLKRPLKCGNSTITALTLFGSACGPGRAYVQWTRAQGPGCTFSRDNTRTAYKNTLALLGSCGAGPALSNKMVPSDVCSGSDPPEQPPPSPKPSPRPPPNPIDSWAPVTRMSVAAGEAVPRGVAMVEAVTNGGACPGPKCVADVLDVAAAQRVVVGVADSGVDETHPDINFVGGTSWLGDEDQPGVDGFGHGTHVAGIIGAKNTGKGVVGVSPDIGIYSLKILDASGNGVLSDAMRAIKWVITEGSAKGIKVVNLSLAGHVDPGAGYYKAMVDLFCGVCKEASDAGISIIAAAGNDGRNINEYTPAVCPTVITVTALDQNGRRGADWSNFADDADAAAKAHTFAGPGTAIVSTVPKSVMDSGYLELGWTSMASPHVAGIAANCIMSGRCNSTGTDAMARIQEAAQTRLNMAKGPNPTPWVSYTPNPVGSKWYGLLVWSQF